MKSCWIFCGAPSENFNIVPPDDVFIIAADSGYSVLKKIGRSPDLLLGDFDSLRGDKPTDCEVITLPAEKDDTDTMFAIKTALEKGYTDITLASSIGGRFDHSFANIQSLAYIAEHGGKGTMLGENDAVYFLSTGEYHFIKQENMYFSVFSYTPTSIVSIKGVKYELNEHCLTNKFPLGVSNEITSEMAYLSVKSGQIIVIFSKVENQICTNE